MHAPTDLMVVLKFVCRGGYYPPVVDKNIILFKKDRRGRRSLQICTIFVILLVGAIHNVFGENLWLAKQSPLDRQFAKQIRTHGPYRFDCYLNIHL